MGLLDCKLEMRESSSEMLGCNLEMKGYNQGSLEKRQARSPCFRHKEALGEERR